MNKITILILSLLNSCGSNVHDNEDVFGGDETHSLEKAGRGKTNYTVLSEKEAAEYFPNPNRKRMSSTPNQ